MPKYRCPNKAIHDREGLTPRFIYRRRRLVDAQGEPVWSEDVCTPNGGQVVAQNEWTCAHCNAVAREDEWVVTRKAPEVSQPGSGPGDSRASCPVNGVRLSRFKGGPCDGCTLFAHCSDKLMPLERTEDD